VTLKIETNPGVYGTDLADKAIHASTGFPGIKAPMGSDTASSTTNRRLRLNDAHTQRLCRCETGGQT